MASYERTLIHTSYSSNKQTNTRSLNKAFTRVASKFIAVSDIHSSYRRVKFVALPTNLATLTYSGTGASTVLPINPLDLFKTDNVLLSQYWKMYVELFHD
jgi:hypothetical protein